MGVSPNVGGRHVFVSVLCIIYTKCPKKEDVYFISETTEQSFIKFGTVIYTRFGFLHVKNFLPYMTPKSSFTNCLLKVHRTKDCYVK